LGGMLYMAIFIVSILSMPTARVIQITGLLIKKKKNLMDRCFEIEQKIQDRFGVEEGEY